MKFSFKNIFKKSASRPLSIQDALLLDDLGAGMTSKSGLRINAETALEVSVVLACVKVIAEDIANIERRIVQITEDEEGREILKTLRNHPVHKLLTKTPNEWMLPGELIEYLIMHAAIEGCGYGFIVRDDVGVPIEILPLYNSQVTEIQNSNFSLEFRLTDIEGGLLGVYGVDDIFVIRGLMIDRFVGADTVQYLREAIGLSIALEEVQSMLFKNGGHPGAIAFKKDGISKDQVDKVRAGLGKISSGRGRFGLAVLDGDWGFKTLSLSSIDMQHLESRKNQVEEICRGFRVSPQMIFHQDKAPTFGSAESFFKAHLTFTLRSWIRRFKEAVNSRLLEDDLEIHLDVSIFMQGSLRDQAVYDRIQVELGLRTRNELRVRDGKNPLPGLDEPLTPLNMTDGKEEENEKDEDSKQSDTF